MNFWDFPASAKYGELREGRHNTLLEGALKSPQTRLTEFQRYEFILYDNEGTEALLFRPRSIVARIGLRLYRAVLDLFPADKEELM